MAGWPVESFVFLAIHPVVSAMGTFAWGDPYLRMWPLEVDGLGVSNRDESQETPGWPFLGWTGTKLATGLSAPE